MRESRIPFYAAALCVLAVTACAAPRSAADGGAVPEPADAEPVRPESAERERLEAIYEARLDSARMRFTEADVAFMTGMIAHHGQAVLMSRLAPDRGASPSIRTLAARIINAQQDEIALMQQWLRERDQTVPEVHIRGTEMMVHGAEHDMDAPGMLTPGELRELERARGAEFDRLFLTYMIRHHRGAVTMVHHLFQQEGAGQDDAIFKIASDIQADQTTEIARMESMLAALPSGAGSQ